ncbi:MAG: hypothetical protein NTY19_31785 [Planctomycetota bacterium]|nr:hypothetical protein [Planctomycetota bacterium]
MCEHNSKKLALLSLVGREYLAHPTIFSQPLRVETRKIEDLNNRKMFTAVGCSALPDGLWNAACKVMLG